jgi:uncharacterized membrane protein
MESNYSTDKESVWLDQGLKEWQTEIFVIDDTQPYSVRITDGSSDELANSEPITESMVQVILDGLLICSCSLFMMLYFLSFFSPNHEVEDFFLNSGAIVAVFVMFFTPIVVSQRNNLSLLDARICLIIYCVLSAVVTIGSLLDIFNPSTKGTEILLRGGLAWILITLTFAFLYFYFDKIKSLIFNRKSGWFQFPSQGLDENWQPEYLDYLFLAFNTSTSFSPTDTPVIARQAKALMMLQSLASIILILIVLARAINILN